MFRKIKDALRYSIITLIVRNLRWVTLTSHTVKVWVLTIARDRVIFYNDKIWMHYEGITKLNSHELHSRY